MNAITQEIIDKLSTENKSLHAAVICYMKNYTEQNKELARLRKQVKTARVALQKIYDESIDAVDETKEIAGAALYDLADKPARRALDQP